MITEAGFYVRADQKVAIEEYFTKEDDQNDSLEEASAANVKEEPAASALHAFFADAPSVVGPNDVQSEQE